MTMWNDETNELFKDPNLTIKDIVNKLGCVRSTVYKQYRILKKQGYPVKTKVNSHHWHNWTREEDVAILSFEAPSTELARNFGVTNSALKARRAFLRKMGLKTSGGGRWSREEDNLFMAHTDIEIAQITKRSIGSIERRRTHLYRVNYLDKKQH